MRLIVCGLVACALTAASAEADDSSAALSAGGIVFTRNTPVRMAAEDLAISPKAVRIRFEFANDTDKDIDTVVAFPLPDIDMATFWSTPLGAVIDNPLNFVGFKAVVDGKAVPLSVEQRAFLKGKDVTALIVGAGLPVNLIAGNGYQKLDALPPDEHRRLMAAGAVQGDGKTEFVPQWIVRTRFYWTQRFPAHKTVVIEHSYQPVTGQSFFSAADAKGPYNGVNYCLDAPTRAAIRAKAAERKKADPEGGGYLTAYQTDYILKTAGNWRGPIGRFRLTLDKLKPGSVMSLCWDGPLQKTGPTTFEAVRTNFAPARDIHLLVLQ
ncbi:MAG: DUF4424 family protein [Alphaproteobacteria bacterium]|nr:DUF4424 family protein [Alphaproteobacteria bacterium]MDE2112173.1 DUF4424 family protein [Alphaproteobacteria bacterium]MDE2495804.1 DUF4424 family protein [Alphaproteobacteria bacterium]